MGDRKARHPHDFQGTLTPYYVTVVVIDHIGVRISTALFTHSQNPGSEAAIGKMTLTRWLQAMGTFGMDLAGIAGCIVDRDGHPYLFEIQQGFFLAPGCPAAKDTEEISKNICAERVLGLPPDIRPDKNSSMVCGARLILAGGGIRDLNNSWRNAMTDLQSLEALGYGRRIFSEEHEAYRATARRFFQKEIEPNVRQWQRDGFLSCRGIHEGKSRGTPLRGDSRRIWRRWR